MRSAVTGDDLIDQGVERRVAPGQWQAVPIEIVVRGTERPQFAVGVVVHTRTEVCGLSAMTRPAQISQERAGR